MQSGIYDNIDINQYHKDAAISSTGINLILDCPQKYYYEYHVKPAELTAKEIEKENAKYKIGRAVHLYVLEPYRFDDTFYSLKEPVNLTTKAGKEVWAQAEVEAKGRLILRDNEYEEIMEISNAVAKHSIWNKLTDGQAEQSIFWEDGVYNTPLKARPDIFNKHLILDIKTTQDIKMFMKSIYTYGYHIQAAMQIDALKQLDGKKRNFAFFVVERKAPYLTACFVLDEKAIEYGRLQYLDGAALYTECVNTNKWNGYAEDFQLISLPKWVYENNQSYV